jgi:hypothetical protein
VITDLSLSAINGKYKVNIPGFSKLEITGENGKPALEFLENDSTKIKATTVRDRNFLTISYKKKEAGSYRLSGFIADKKISGEGKDPSGQSFTWSATLEEATAEKAKADTTKKTEQTKVGDLVYPFVAFGNDKRN